MATPFIAQITIFAGTFAPRHHAFCNGQMLSIAQNTALFSLIGTIYGGNGQTTFGLPNLQGRVPMHWGSGPGLTARQLGEAGGSATVTLTPTQMPAHNHTLAPGAATTADSPNPLGRVPATVAAGTPYADAGGAAMSAGGGGAVGTIGGNQPHNNLMPYLCLNFIIALQGIFPSRN